MQKKYWIEHVKPQIAALWSWTREKRKLVPTSSAVKKLRERRRYQKALEASASRDQLEQRYYTAARKGPREEDPLQSVYRLPDQDDPSELCSREERLRMIDQMLQAWRPFPFNPDSEGSKRAGELIEQTRIQRAQEKLRQQTPES